MNQQYCIIEIKRSFKGVGWHSKCCTELKSTYKLKQSLSVNVEVERLFYRIKKIMDLRLFWPSYNYLLRIEKMLQRCARTESIAWRDSFCQGRYFRSSYKYMPTYQVVNFSGRTYLNFSNSWIYWWVSLGFSWSRSCKFYQSRHRFFLEMSAITRFAV